MVSTFSWVEYTATPGNASASGVPTNLNLGSTNAVDLAPSTYPITAGTYSYAKWVRGMWTGSFTRVDNIQFWKSAGDYVGSEALNTSVTTGTFSATDFLTPTNDQETKASVAMPTADPGTQNVGVGGSLTGSITSSTAGSNECDYIVIQASIGAGASAGATNTKTFTLQYDEI